MPAPEFPTGGHAAGASPAFRLPRAVAWLRSDWNAPTWLIADDRGETVPLHFDVILPDGTWFTDLTNSRLLETVRRVTFEIRTGPLASSEDNRRQVAAARNIMILAAWMRTRHVFRFAELTPALASEHLAARAAGIESCLGTLERMRKVLGRYEHRPDRLPGTSELLELCAIFVKPGRLPRTMDLVRDFRRRHGLPFLPVGERRRDDARLTRSALIALATDVRRLWTMASRIEGDRALSDPFPHGVDAAIEELGRPGGRTPTMPVPVAVAIARAACDWVLEAGPAILRDVDKGKNRLRPLDDRDIVASRILPVEFTKTRVAPGRAATMTRAYRHFVPVSCLIAILVFTARRGGEAMRAKSGAISGSTEDGHWISLPILKSLRRVDATPCPRIVADAVGLLERWSADARGAKGTDKLFVPPRGCRPALRFHPETYLDEFAAFMGADRLPDAGRRWHFTLHQFRRVFVILMVWQYEVEVEAVGHHLRHFHLRTTFVYCQDAELRMILSEEQRRYTAAKLRAIVSDAVRAVGGFAKKLSRLVDRFRRTLRMSGDDGIVRKVEDLAHEGRIVIRGTPWGYCGCRNTAVALRKAACLDRDWIGGVLMDDGLPDPSASSETTCIGCVHHMLDSLRQARWDTELAKVEAALASPGMPQIMRDAAQGRRKGLLAGLALLRKANDDGP